MVPDTEFLSCPNCGQTFLASGSTTDRFVQCAHCAHQGGRKSFATMAAPQQLRKGRLRATTLPQPRASAESGEALRSPSRLRHDISPTEIPSIDPEPTADLPAPEPSSPASIGSELTNCGSTLDFACPSCATMLGVAADLAGEALDCQACGQAVISPDPQRAQPAMLFTDLLEKMGVTETADAPAPKRQIASFKLRPTEDTAAWLDSKAHPEGRNRAPMWEPAETASGLSSTSSELPTSVEPDQLSQPIAQYAPADNAFAYFQPWRPGKLCSKAIFHTNRDHCSCCCSARGQCCQLCAIRLDRHCSRNSTYHGCRIPSQSRQSDRSVSGAHRHPSKRCPSATSSTIATR